MRENKFNYKMVIILLTTIICLLAVGGLILYLLLTDKNKSNLNNVENNDVIVLHENNTREIYIANEKEYLKNGTKKRIASNAIYEIQVLNNKIYYIDIDKYLNVYNIRENKNARYKLPESNSNVGSREIMPGEEYTLIYDTLDDSKFIRINMSSKEIKVLDIKTRSHNMHFDSKNNMLYYDSDLSNSPHPVSIEQYDIKNEKHIKTVSKTEHIAVLGGDEEYVYLGLNSANDISSDTLMGYDKKNNALIELYNRPYISGISSSADLIKINNTLYQMRNDHKAIIKYSNNDYSYVFEGDRVNFINIGNKIYFCDFVNFSDYDGYTEIKYYEYDIITEKINTLTNQYAIKLFDYYDVIANGNHMVG